MDATTVAVDLAKRTFQLAVVDSRWRVPFPSHILQELHQEANRQKARRQLIGTQRGADVGPMFGGSWQVRRFDGAR